MLQRRSGGGHHDVPEGVLHRGSRGDQERISCQRSCGTVRRLSPGLLKSTSLCCTWELWDLVRKMICTYFLVDQLVKVWFNSLCCDLEGLPPAKAQSLLLKRIESLEQVRMKVDLRKCNDHVSNKRLPQNWESAKLQAIICILRVKGKAFLPRCREQRLQTLTNKTRYIRVHQLLANCYSIFFCFWDDSLVG